MKRNLLTLFLIIVTLTVWAIIFFKIFNREQTVVIPSRPSVKKEIPKKDTLLLNYRNPFRIREKVITNKVTVEIQKEIISAPTFIYKGLIKSRKGTFLMINDTLLRPKDKIFGYTITKIYPDSLLVRKRGCNFFVKKLQ